MVRSRKKRMANLPLLQRGDSMKIFREAGRFVIKNLPTILTIVGTSGVVATAILTAKAAPKAVKIFETQHKEDKPGETSVLTVVTAAKPYIPAIVVGTASMACILAANRINARRYLALCSSYNLLADEYSIFKRALLSQASENGAAMVAGAVMTAKPKEEGPDIDENGETLHWFYDVHSMTWFRSTWHKVDEAKMRINDKFSYDGFVSLCQYYEELGIPYKKIDRDIGWDCERLIYDYECPFVPFEHSEKTFENGEVGYAIWFPIEPDIAEFEAGTYE